MSYLLDTHTLLWFDHDPDKLSVSVKTICNDSSQIIYISMVSIWEIQIKVSLGKLELPLILENMIDKQLNSNALQLLHIEQHHIYRIQHLLQHHKDPFDRLLEAQAIEEDLMLLTKDTNIAQYSLDTLW